VNGTVYASDEKSSNYKFSSVSFNSGTANSVTLSASVDDQIINTANILNPNFNNGQTDWTVEEGTGIGQVQDSSNSASGANGSIKFKYNSDAAGTLIDTGTPYDPYIAQTVSVEPNTDYTLSMYLLEKNQAPVSADFGVFMEASTTLLSNATVLASKESIYGNLSADDQADDSFRRDSISFNSGLNTSLTIFAQYNGKNDGADVRVDDFELSYLGAPATDETAFFDSFRLVSH